ncbi:MAG TPA: large conductance mechanosensitive channel protein MscL [Bacillales bacterium]|nr:large conductance mechanosensitive channel protein MscL [Bacillales bacterium]
MMKEFKQFAKFGSMLDLSIGVVVGAAFGKVIYSLVNDILMPPIGLLLGKVNFSNLFINLSNRHFETVDKAQEAGAPTINYGLFLSTIIHFFIIMAVVFLVVRQINRMRDPKQDPIKSMTKKECPYCYSNIPYRAKRCPFCTSDLDVKHEEPKVKKKSKKSKINIKVG